MADRGYVSVDAGRIFYERFGEGAPLVLNAGALDVRMWRPQIEALSSVCSLVLCDLRGYGRSS